MAQYFAIDGIGELDGALIPQPMPGNVVGAKLRSTRCYINLASQAVITIADNVVLARLPMDSTFVAGIITANATMGATATLAVGTNPVHASNGQYRAAAISTAVDAPALFGVTAAKVAAATTANQLVYLTIGVASLPAAGILVIDLFYLRR